MVRVEQGKGGIDPEVPLSQTLLQALREYYRWMKAGNLPVPRDRKWLAGRQAGYREDGMAGCARGPHPCRYYQARYASYSTALLRNTPTQNRSCRGAGRRARRHPCTTAFACVQDRPGPRLVVPSYFRAISFRCHTSRVSGVTIVAALCQSASAESFALAASRRRWSSVNRIRRLPCCSRRTRFSSRR